MTGFAALAAQYDGFIVDLWGVVHDGVTPYPGAVDCLTRLRAAGKPAVFLSNAPRRSAPIAAALASMGIPHSLYTGIVSSGEAVHDALKHRTDPAFAELGTKFYHLGPERDRNVFAALPLIQVASPGAAEFVLNTGPDDYLSPHDEAVYMPVLNACLAARLPMICANPDLEVIRDGKRLICAGLLAQYYEAQGGTVIMRGKPDPAIYSPTLAMLGTDPSRTLAIGDSLRTDIAGAQAAGIASCWVLSGIHALNAADAPAVAAEAGFAPVAILPGFAW